MDRDKDQDEGEQGVVRCKVAAVATRAGQEEEQAFVRGGSRVHRDVVKKNHQMVSIIPSVQEVVTNSI